MSFFLIVDTPLVSKARMIFKFKLPIFTGKPGGSLRFMNSLSFRNFANGTKASRSLFNSLMVSGKSLDLKKIILNDFFT